MKKTLRTAALLGLLSLAATGCMKENVANPVAITNGYEIAYSTGSYYGHDNLNSDEEWDLFLDRMLALAKEGYEVTIFGNTSSTSSAKEVVTYTTTSEEDAKNWAKDMIQQGYEVHISYDDRTGLFTCTAIK